MGGPMQKGPQPNMMMQMGQQGMMMMNPQMQQNRPMFNVPGQRPQQMMLMPQMKGPQMGGMPPQMGGGKGGFPQQGMMPQKGMVPQQGMPMGQGQPQARPGQMGAPGGMAPGAGQPRQEGGAALTAQKLASAPPGMQKQMLGEQLYPAVSRLQPELAGKITGMMLEMDNSELLMMLESEAQLRQKVDEAMRVLQQMPK